MKQLMTVTCLLALGLANAQSVVGRERIRCVQVWCTRPQATCVSAPRCIMSQPIMSCRTNPCLCPQDLAYDPGPEDELFYYIVDHNDCECGGACDAPYPTLLATDSFVEFPQMCSDSAGCAFVPIGRSVANQVGIPSLKDPEFVPMFQYRTAATVHLINRSYISFRIPSSGRVVTAIAFIFKLDDFTYPLNLHPKHPNVGMSKAHTVVLGFQTNGVGTHTIDFDVDPRHVKPSPDHKFGFHVNTGGVTYPIVMMEPITRN
jgi:hypothetical protein